MEISKEELEEWRSKNSGCKGYTHFDLRTSLKNDATWNYITDPACVAKHGFYPFIEKDQRSQKYDKRKPKDERIKKKERPICYAAHIDDLIYRYYAFLLNKQYNARVLDDGLDNTAIAYRNNHQKEDNITFAKRAIDFIKDSGECYVIVGDFTSFFDTLSHSYLKERLCDLLDVEKLPDDYYAVFKNITRFSTWNFESLIKLYKESLSQLFKDKPITAKLIKNFNSQPRAISPENFKKYKNTEIKKNTLCGIPQGSAISGILANTYMLQADKTINERVKSLGGLYMRYCDDFIAVLPRISENEFSEFYKWILDYIASLEGDKTKGGLTLSPEKTQSFYYDNGTLMRYDTNGFRGKALLNYLGFSFDGKEVLIRDRAFTKYYYRMRRKASGIIMMNGKAVENSKPKHYCAHKLYNVYTVNGAYGNKDLKGGNFITYVNRAAKKFNNANITRPIRKHKLRVKRALNPERCKWKLEPDELSFALECMRYMYLSRRQRKMLNKKKNENQ